MKPRICIIQPVMKGYRRPFFLGLEEKLQRNGISLEVVYGTPWHEESMRGDNVDLAPPLGTRIKSRMLAGKILWIPAFSSILRSDFVIVEHANKHVINYPLALLNAIRLKRVGYWGHGRDRQADSKSLGERYKRRSLHWADWWFAYTEGASRYVCDQGYDAARVTTVGNSIDTRELRDQIANVTHVERSALLTELSLSPDGKRLIYCGSLYGNKRLDLMLPAAEAVHEKIPDLQLIVLGGGPLAEEVQRFAATRPWVRYVGPQFGHRKSQFLSLAHAWLNPGLVGLGILDAFSAGLPLITTDLPIHSPEIEYLIHGQNGLMVPPDVGKLSRALIDLLQSPSRLHLMRQGALASAQKYSIETMVENYAEGIFQWLRS